MYVCMYVCVYVCVCVRGREGGREVRCGAVVRGIALQAGRSRVRFPMVSLEFFIDILLVDSACNRNEFRNVSWEVKAAGANG